MRLARKFLITVVAVALAVLVIGVTASIRSEAVLHEADIARDHLLIGHALARVVERIPADRLPIDGPDFVRSVLPASEHVSARLVFADDPARTPVDDAVLQIASSGEPTIAARSEARALFVTVIPLRTPGVVVEIVEPLADQDRVVNRTAWRFALIGLGLIVGFAAATSYLGRRFIGGPMKLLVAQARRIGGGRLDEAVPVDQRDEIGELAHELNTMAKRLRDADELARVEAEKRLLAVEQLRHADRLATVGTLASGMAHELGTPLAVVQTRASLVEEATADPEVAKSAKVITEQVERMTRIIRQVLDFARRSTPRTAPVSLSDLVENAIGMLAPMSKKHGVEIRVHSMSPIPVMADPGLVRQVLTNLVMNAVQASAGRAETVDVRVSRAEAQPPDQPSSPPMEYGLIEVEDRGRGIAAAHLPHVFEPFFTTKDVGEGTGLGLSVAWGIVHDHGGWIDVDSELDEGSRFRVYLPCAPG